MLKKLKITTYVFILCLFGLTLITVSPVKAADVHDRARDFQSELQLCDRTLEESMAGYEAIRQSLAVLEGENVTCVAESRTLTEQLTAANAETGSLREQVTVANAETGSLREQLTAANAEMGPLREQVILANADRDHCRTSEGDGSLRLTRRVSPVRSGQTAREYAEMCIIDICVNPR